MPGGSHMAGAAHQPYAAALLRAADPRHQKRLLLFHARWSKVSGQAALPSWPAARAQPVLPAPRAGFAQGPVLPHLSGGALAP